MLLVFGAVVSFILLMMVRPMRVPFLMGSVLPGVLFRLLLVLLLALLPLTGRVVFMIRLVALTTLVLCSLFVGTAPILSSARFVTLASGGMVAGCTIRNISRAELSDVNEPIISANHFSLHCYN